mgnify:CR=1 FL=1
MENAFSEVIGQQDVIRRLVQTAREDRVPQALLFCGAPGVGKLALAMGFAAYLLSEGTPSLPVTAPNARAMLRLWEHPDLHFTSRKLDLRATTSPSATTMRNPGMS